MKRKLVITTLENHVITSILEDDDIIELHVSDRQENDCCRLGNIYIGKVKKIVKNIDAAFVEIGKGVECYYDMNEKGSKPVRVGDELLVQISKEAVKTKQPTVTRNLSFAGKYAVLTVGDTRIGVSSKIEKDKKESLQAVMEPFQSKEYGFIVRTNAKDCEPEELKAEAAHLIAEYERVQEIAPTRVCFSCLKEGLKPYIAELKNIYQEGLTDIVVEDKEIYGQMQEYLMKEQPGDLEKLRLYEDKLLPLHKLYSVEKNLKDALQEKVWMKSGAYLVIQPTEALTVIDVNTGKCISRKKDHHTYFNINLEAAREAAKQIRLRNLSGIILIDFINLDDEEKMEQLLSVFRSYLRRDPIQTLLIDVTKLQLVEVTRKKVRKPLHETLTEDILICNRRK